MGHIKWTEIEGFHNVRKTVVRYPELLGGTETVRYHGKVKLHGTNAAVQIVGGKVKCQSRTNMIAPGCDNAGFAAWVETVQDEFLKRVPINCVIFGEWCGPGIQKGVAVNQIPRKCFAVFALQPLDEPEATGALEVDPDVLEEYVEGIPDVKVIPWHGDFIDVPWLESADVLQPITEEISRRVFEVEACDPFIRAEFGVEGIGEGIVWYPVSHPGRKYFGDLCFKSKGEKHQNIAKAKPAQVDASVAKGAQDFAEMVLTEARLEQGVRAITHGELRFENGLIGPFLKWVNVDVARECRDELEVSGVDSKLAMKVVSDRARKWYLEKLKSI